jgi:hypothetical protein
LLQWAGYTLEELRVSSKKALSESQKTVIQKRISGALARVASLHGPETLHECRALFRKSVPLHLRAYVAAALLMDGLLPDAKPRAATSGSGARAAHAEPKGGAKRGERQREPKREAQREPKGGQEASAQSARREQRYKGDGLSIFISAGRRQRLYARVILDMLHGLPGIQEQSIGELRIMDNYSFVTIDPAVEDLVVAGLNGREFRGRPLSVNRAKKREEQALGVRDGSERPGADQPDGELPGGEQA